MATLTLKASVELPAPFDASALSRFFATVPDSAQATISTRMGGDQRDPYPVGYFIQATWEEKA